MRASERVRVCVCCKQICKPLKKLLPVFFFFFFFWIETKTQTQTQRRKKGSERKNWKVSDGKVQVKTTTAVCERIKNTEYTIAKEREAK